MPTETTDPPVAPTLTWRDLCRIFRCSRCTLWRLRKQTPNFPRPIDFSGRPRWRREDVLSFIATTK